MSNIIPLRRPLPAELQQVRPMQRLAKRGPIFMPESAFENSTKTSLNREDVVYTCEQCGVIEPIQVAIGGDPERCGYLQGECICRYEAREHENMVRQLAENRAAYTPRAVSRTYTWLGIDQERLSLMTFETFNPDAQPAQYRNAILSAYDFARGYAAMCLANCTGQPNVLFVSPGFGTGKTHLACAILNRLREHGVPCLFTTAQDLFNCLYAAPFEDKPIILRQASDTPLLVVDDLDKLHVPTETDGAFQKRTLFDILDRRYKGQRPTIITTNKEDLSQWLDEATISRLSENIQPVPMVGADYRRLKRAK